MTTSRFALALLIACVALSGCKKADDGPGKCPHMAQNDTATPDEPASAGPDTSACDGRPVEMITYRWPDEKIKLEQQIVRGEDGAVIPHGVKTSYWEEGGKKVEMHYGCGVLHGSKKAWHRDGTKWQEAGYDNGKGHGLWTEWLPNGNEIQQFTMRHGAWHGTFTKWHANGKIKSQVEWIDGKRQGTETWWDEEGNFFKRVEWVDGVEQPGVAP